MTYLNLIENIRKIGFALLATNIAIGSRPIENVK